MVTTPDMDAPFRWWTRSNPILAQGGGVHAIKWQLQHRYMQVEAMAELVAPVNEAEARQIACAA
jgi:hypothetical protein